MMTYSARDRVTMELRRTPGITDVVNAWVTMHAELERLREQCDKMRAALEYVARSDEADFVWGGDHNLAETARQTLRGI